MKALIKYLLILTSAFVVACSEPAKTIVDNTKTVTIFGDSLCAPTDSWARRLNEVEGLIVTDLCIPGYRATHSIFAESIVNDTSDIFVMTLGVNDATGMTISEYTANQIGINTETIDDFRSAYAHIIGVALLNGSELICVLPPITGVAWVQPVMPQIWDVIIDICDGVGSIVRAAPSDAPDQIHYGYYGDELMYQIMLEALTTEPKDS